MSSILNETDDKNNKNFIYDTSIVPEIIKDSEDEEELALKEDNSDDNDDVIALNGVYYDDCDDDNNCTLNVPSDEDVILWNDEPCSSKDFLKRKLNSNETLNNEKRFKIDDFASKFSDNDIPTDNAANYNDISKIEPVSETYYISEFSDDDDILDLTTEEFTFSTKKKQETEVIDLTGDEKLAFSIQQLDLELEKQRKLQEQQDAEYALKLSLELNAEIPVETALQRNKIENSNNLVYPILSNSSFDDTSKEKLKEIERTVPFDKQNASIAPPLVKREWGFKSTVSPIVPTEFPFHLNPLTQQRLKQARMDAAGKRALATETPVFLSASTLMQLPSIIPPTQKTYWTPTVNNLQRSSNADDMVDSDLKNLLSNVAHNENITPINRRLPTPALMVRKTIQTIALLLSNKPTSDGTNDITNQVLIICPKSLLNQWKEEMIDKTNYFTEKSIHIYHNDSPGGKEKNLKILKQYEVVITTYGAITSEWINEKKIEKASNAKKKNKQIKDFFLDEEADKTKKSSKRPANRLGNLFQINWWRIVLGMIKVVGEKS
ncbi:hypothetical protein HK099_004945 [Clydaea vesicula]|uniref:SNF2 N-terminal domain-containing protein n=1 Tax=Clydaea vesicula TaxID=447962 RepID=A0AAD5XZX0_9FUNG|nr:hypothetical protein HK099_004945 [Clydaea vesicula]